MNTSRRHLGGGGGTQTAALGYAGYDPARNRYSTESYNGTSHGQIVIL
jgi:hypothetical protein